MEQPTRMQMQWFYSNAQDVRQGGCLLVATDIASRGFDLPQTTHIYNFDLPKTAVDYLHRAGRTGRLPFSKEVCSVTNLITNDERFVLRKFENELMFQCEEVCLDSLALWNSTDACLKRFFFSPFSSLGTISSILRTCTDVLLSIFFVLAPNLRHFLKLLEDIFLCK